MIKLIKRWISRRGQVKAFKKIKAELENNPKLMIRAKESFEKSFGVNSNTRTKEQWQRLANVYGIDLICQVENLTPEEVQFKCKETFSDKCKRILNGR